MAVRKPAAGDHTAEYDPEEIKREKAITIVSYLGWVAIIPYVTKKDSSYARFHIVQAMYLFLLQIVCAVLAAILSGLGALAVMLLTNWFGVVLMVLMNLLSFALNVGCLVFVIMGLVYAGKGKAKDLPMFNKLRGLGWLK